MRLRALAVTASLALAATCLTACDSKVGLAAKVDGHGITDKSVTSYINPSGPTAAGIAAEEQNGATPTPARVLVTQTLVQEQVFLSALVHLGGAPTTAELKAQFANVVNQISNGESTTATFDADFYKTSLAPLGYRQSFEPLIVKVYELEGILVSRTKATSLGDLVKAVDKAKISVSVSGRYGAWDPNELEFSASSTAGLPSYVKIGPDTAASATDATAGQ